MDIKSLSQYLRINRRQGLFDLFRPVIIRPTVKNQPEFLRYEVRLEEEMRIDLVFKNIYDLEFNTVGLYLEHIDILLALNNIDNPLNIKKGTIIYYPSELGRLDEFRINAEQDLDLIKTSVGTRLAVPNKSTRKDKSRGSYVENGYSLPPVVQESPKPPVKIENGRFSIGGL